MKKAGGRLLRPRHRMPEWIRRAVLKAGVTKAYRARPPYQRNDYVGWIVRAKREDTQKQRLAQMLRELKKGGVYMNMRWRPIRAAKK